MQNEPPSIIIPAEERDRYLDEFNKIKAKFPEPRDRMETPFEKEARMNLIYREMGKLFVMEERRLSGP